MKTLVVYFSRKGHVKKIAQNLAHNLNAQIEELSTTERTSGILGFWWCGRFAMHRWPMPLKPLKFNPKDFDKVIICSPIWAFTASSVIFSYVKNQSGNFKNLSYCFVHFSPFMRFKNTVKTLNKISGCEAKEYTSISMPWGLVLRKKKF